MGRIIQIITLLFGIAFIGIGYSNANGHMQNEYIVKFKGNPNANTCSHFCSENKSDSQQMIKKIAGMYHVKMDQEGLEDFKRSYKGEIAFIEPNYIYSIADFEEVEDQGIPKAQWGLNSTAGVNAEKAWTKTKGNSGVVVAVIDTGVDYDHYALKNSMWRNNGETFDGTDSDGNGYVDDVFGVNVLKRTGDPKDDHGHGTHCAGIIAADSPSLKGIAPKVSIMGIKFLNKKGEGTLAGAIEAIEYAVNHGADVLSNSWGGKMGSEALEDAIRYAEKMGVLFVAAAGNNNRNNDRRATYPANYKIGNVISVAASTSSGMKSYFSNYGKETVDLFAPGSNILSSFLNNKTKSYSGTSMATPFVSGAAALYLSYRGKVHYSVVKDAIFEGVDYSSSFKNYVKTGGKLDAYKMLLE